MAAIRDPPCYSLLAGRLSIAFTGLPFAAPGSSAFLPQPPFGSKWGINYALSRYREVLTCLHVLAAPALYGTPASLKTQLSAQCPVDAQTCRVVTVAIHPVTVLPPTASRHLLTIYMFLHLEC
jgi:hypothetical protein